MIFNLFKKKFAKRRGIFLTSVFLVSFILGIELALRSFLGSPTLSISDNQIEYMFAPSQSVRRFGNRIEINKYGMRSPNLLLPKRTNMYRVIVFGDSVINGGHLTDQSELATTLLTSKNTEVFNVSAGSWGPGNIFAYLEKFGRFDADALILVLSSHDLEDDRTFAPLNPNTHPTQIPRFAMEEFINRYLLRYLPISWSNATSKGLGLENDAKESFNELIMIMSESPSSCLILHFTRNELILDNLPENLVTMQKIAKANGVYVVLDREFMSPDVSYRDDIHLNAHGQKGLAAALKACIDNPSPNH